MISLFTSMPFKDDERIKQISLIREKYNWSNIAAETMVVYRSVVSEQ
jgi:hypothetical protein